MQSFGQIMFTEAVQAEQEKRGSRETYARMAERDGPEALGEDEVTFLRTRDSFYLASVSETGWPYVQHRGGTAGFVHVTGPTQLAFADYRGNRQYVTTGHLAKDDRVSLFFMDYPRKARLKILGHARVTEASEDPELTAHLTAEGAPAAERVVRIEVVAFDWNCPKYISPRLTEAELASALTPRLEAYTQQIADLEARLDAVDPNWRKT